MEEENKYLEKENYILVKDDLWYRTHITTQIINQYKTLLGKKCANLGSNSGYLCFLIAEFNEIEEVIGFDINNNALSYGETIIRKFFSEEIGNKVKFKFSNLSNIDSKNDYFDSIIDFHTLEHIYPKDLNEVVCEKYRILKNGGYVILSIPYEYAFHDPNEYPPQHVSFFNEKKIIELFESNGFKTIECYKDYRVSKTNPLQLCLTAIFRKNI